MTAEIGGRGDQVSTSVNLRSCSHTLSPHARRHFLLRGRMHGGRRSLCLGWFLVSRRAGGGRCRDRDYASGGLIQPARPVMGRLRGVQPLAACAHRQLAAAGFGPPQRSDEKVDLSQSTWACWMSGAVKGFGCRPITDGSTRTGAGVRKPPMKETAGRGTYKRATRPTGMQRRAQLAPTEQRRNQSAERLRY
jgi:hypothetical protein